ncbi:MAG: hypothetical protein ACTSWN_02610 [Promethearchaeota archaeon]
MLMTDWGLPPYINAGNYIQGMIMELTVSGISFLLVINSLSKLFKEA